MYEIGMQWFVCRVEDVILMHLLVTVGRCCVRVRSCTLMQQLQREEQLELRQAMQDYCLLMLNTNGFFYLD